MNKKTHKECKECGVLFKLYRTTDKYCSIECANKNKKVDLKLKSMNKKPIRYYSEKRQKLNKEYERVRIEVLSEAKFKCFIDGCTNIANTIEHLMKRKGYADDWARENNIPLLIDKRYLRACCLHHNGQLESDPELSKKYQYSNVSGKKKSDE